MKKKLLVLSAIAISKFAGAQCTELFISEYCEGTGNNKGVEIYNPTANSINLSAGSYVLARYSNGSTTITDQLALTGVIAPGDVWVIVNGQTTSSGSSPACDPAMQALADQLDGAYPAPTYMNGDDAITLEKNGVKVDIFGKIGEDPGTAWTDVFPYTDAAGTWLTANHTLIRKKSIKQGVTSNPANFNTFAEWDTIPVNTWDSLGKHTCDCATVSIKENSKKSFVSIFPNPSKDNHFTITSKDGIKLIEIYSMVGAVVSRKEFEGIEFSTVIETPFDEKGIYFVNVFFENGNQIAEKIIVQ